MAMDRCTGNKIPIIKASGSKAFKVVKAKFIKMES